MKIFTTLFLTLSLLTACETVSLENEEKHNETMANVNVNYKFVIDETSWQTRATTTGTSSVTRIALKVFDSENNQVTEVKQRKDDTSFGTITGLKLKPGNYTFVAVAHMASSTTAEDANIVSPERVDINEAYIPFLYACSVEKTIESSSTSSPQTVTLPINLCVSRLRVYFTNAVPNYVKKVILSLNTGGEQQTSYSFNPKTGYNLKNSSFSHTITIPTNYIGRTDLDVSIFGQFDVFPKTVDANIQVFDTNDEEIIERNYKDVVMKRGYIHSVKTTFDLMDIETSFTFEDWTEEDVPQ